MLQKSSTVDERQLAGAARLRARVLAILSGALRATGMDQSALARKVGVRKSAVSSLFRGNGNIRIDTIGEYLAAMGFEADITVVRYGELERARDERRAPGHVCVTISDRDRVNNPTGEFGVVAVTSTSRRDVARNAMLEHWHSEPRHGERELLFVSDEVYDSKRETPGRESYLKKIGAVRA